MKKLIEETFYEITIVADWNDADYLTKVTKLSKEYFEEYYEVIEVIDMNKSFRHNFNDIRKGLKTDDEAEFLDNIIPYGYPDGCELHSIESMKIRLFENGSAYDITVK